MQNMLMLNFWNVGYIVTVPIREYFGIFIHFGIVSNRLGTDGYPMVIANSRNRRGPALVTWTEFTQGLPLKDCYFPSKLHPAQVLANAYAMFGQPYRFLNWNCECFAKACHGLEPVSTQVQVGIALAALTGLAVAVAKAS